MKNNAKEELLHEYDLPEATSDKVLKDAKIGLNHTDDFSSVGKNWML